MNKLIAAAHARFQRADICHASAAPMTFIISPLILPRARRRDVEVPPSRRLIRSLYFIFMRRQ